MLSLPFKLNQTGRNHIPRQKHKVTNWPAYDASLRQRGSLTRLEQLKRLPTDLIIVFVEFFGTRAAFGLEM